jgi:hypothetical protein
MVQIWRPGDNFCAFETLSKLADFLKKFALMQKRQSFCYPIVQQHTTRNSDKGHQPLVTLILVDAH